MDRNEIGLLNILIRISETLERIEKNLKKDQRLYDQHEAALYLGWSYRKVGDLYRARILPGSKPTGKKIFFDKEMLDEFLLSAMSKSAKEIEQEAPAYLATSKHKKR